MIYLFISFGLASCVKKETILQSDLIGYVKLHDVAGTPLDDNSGIAINAEMNGTVLAVNSDKTGKFIFTNLAVGTYNFTYSSSNLPTLKKYGISHTGIGSNFIGSLNISAKPDFKINTFQIMSSTGIYKFSGAYSKTETRNIAVFFGRVSTVSKDNAIFSQTITGTSGQLPSTINFSNSNLTSRGFSIGETIYAIAYPSTAYANSFVELETGKLIFPALGEPSSIQSFVLQ